MSNQITSAQVQDNRTKQLFIFTGEKEHITYYYFVELEKINGRYQWSLEQRGLLLTDTLPEELDWPNAKFIGDLFDSGRIIRSYTSQEKDVVVPIIELPYGQILFIYNERWRPDLVHTNLLEFRQTFGAYIDEDLKFINTGRSVQSALDELKVTHVKPEDSLIYQQNNAIAEQTGSLLRAHAMFGQCIPNTYYELSQEHLKGYVEFEVDQYGNIGILHANKDYNFVYLHEDMVPVVRSIGRTFPIDIQQENASPDPAQKDRQIKIMFDSYTQCKELLKLPGELGYLPSTQKYKNKLQELTYQYAYHTRKTSRTEATSIIMVSEPLEKWHKHIIAVYQTSVEELVSQGYMYCTSVCPEVPVLVFDDVMENLEQFIELLDEKQNLRFFLQLYKDDIHSVTASMIEMERTTRPMDKVLEEYKREGMLQESTVQYSVSIGWMRSLLGERPEVFSFGWELLRERRLAGGSYLDNDILKKYRSELQNYSAQIEKLLQEGETPYGIY